MAFTADPPEEPAIQHEVRLTIFQPADQDINHNTLEESVARAVAKETGMKTRADYQIPF